MSIHFHSRPSGAMPGGGPYHKYQVWRTSGGPPSRGGTTPALWAILAALVIVALLTLGLHVLFH